MKKLLKQFLVVLILMNFALSMQSLVVYAETKAPAQIKNLQTPSERLKQVGSGTNLPSFSGDSGTQHPDAPADYLEEGIGAVTSPFYFVIDAMRLLLSTVAFFVVVISTLRLVATHEEEEATKVKKNLTMAVGGLILVQLADVGVKKMFFGEQGEAFEDIATGELYAEDAVDTIRGVLGFLNVFGGILAVLVIVIRGFSLVSSAGEEEAMTKAKTHVLYALAGLVIVGLSEFVVLEVVFPERGGSLPSINKGRELIVSLTNYIASFISILSFASLFYAGYLYVGSGGNEENTEKVKKIITSSLIAIVISLGAFTLVNTLVTLDNSEGPQATEASQAQQNVNN
jgi:hypothetical protein